MRLINIHTLELDEFHGKDIPPYFILSHRWEGNEISFKDVKKGRNLESPGWLKVKNFCDYVKWHADSDRPSSHRGDSKVEYVWVDTCCIDKRSSAELSQAINSMYAYYQRAQICYIYLNDVSAGEKDSVAQELQSSQWFTRGWTLQELLAPSRLVFVDKDWTEVLGDEVSLATSISKITGIEGVFSRKGRPQFTPT